MVQLTFATALVAFAAIMGVNAASLTGTYAISQPGPGGGYLSLDSKDSAASIAGQAQEWIVEPGFLSGTVALKNTKYGTYLGYDSAQMGAEVKGANNRRSFNLVPTNDKPNAYFITTAGVNCQALYVDQGAGNLLDDPPVVLGEKASFSDPWTFELKAPSKPSGNPKPSENPKPNEAPKPNTKPNGCGQPSPSLPKWENRWN
ncbi:hypothetical protein FRC07_002176 [Ceratobasidium sp. 392]|nr:hypothetical protein FRC07_002176 [Ceratobasidium sp. 392]